MENTNSHRSVKLSLKSITKSPETVAKLEEVAQVITRIWTHTLQFLKAYQLHVYETQNAAEAENDDNDDQG